MLPRAEFLASLPRRRLAASLVVRDVAGRVLLVEPTYKDVWLLPGGTVEADESPSQGARREMIEKLGIDLGVGRLLSLMWVPPAEDDPHGALFLDYDGGVVSDDVAARFVPAADEIRSFGFVGLTELPSITGPRTVQRVSNAVRALETGTVVES